MAALTRDLHDALASPAPVVALIGADADTFCLGLAVGSSVDGRARRRTRSPTC